MDNVESAFSLEDMYECRQHQWPGGVLIAAYQNELMVSRVRAVDMFQALLDTQVDGKADLTLTSAVFLTRCEWR